MNENKDYVSHLNKARKKRNQKWDPRYLLLAIVVVLLIGLGVLAAVNVKSAVSGKAARKSDNVIEEPGTGLEAASASNAAREEEEKAKEEQEIQSAIDAYQNLGIVQVSGYVNIRETPDMKGNIIGKVSGDGACEVLGEEGEWSHITSGGIEGYISSQYLVTGEEAKELAKYFIIITAIFMPQNAFLHASYFTLRSGGRTIITFLFDSVFIWVVSVSVAFTLSRFTALPVLAIYALVQAADFIKCIIGFILVKKGVWLRNIVTS